ncbi:MAG: clostripain-related cysteine peptidase, partial [Candidatus Thermoplasmatota archaeon]
MRPLPAVAAVVLLLALLPALPVRAPPDKDWTVLVYMDADNDLEDVGIEDFIEMAAVGSTPEVNVVVQMDRTPLHENTYGNWSTARRFYVTAGMTPDAPGTDLGEVNMANPAELVSFVNWGIGNYPAAHYFLVLWDHGDGWQGVVVDDDPVVGDRLNATELRTAMSAIVAANGRRIDLLGNDACRMTLEIQYELADFVDYFVGSEKDEPREGWQYTPFLQALTAEPTMSPLAVATALVDTFVESYTGVSLYSVALSAVSAAGLRPLVAGLNAFLDELAVHQPFFTQEVLSARGA